MSGAWRQGRSGAAVCCVKEGRVRQGRAGRHTKLVAVCTRSFRLPWCASGGLAPPYHSWERRGGGGKEREEDEEEDEEKDEEEQEVLQEWRTSSVWWPLPKEQRAAPSLGISQ